MENTDKQDKELWQKRATESSQQVSNLKNEIVILRSIIEKVQEDITITVEDDYYRQRLLEMIERRLEVYSAL